MDHRRRIIHTIKDVEVIRNSVLNSVTETVTSLRRNEENPKIFFEKIRFKLMGHDPLTKTPLNVVEQLNQTFTILATLNAVECLFGLHHDAEGFHVALGTCSGRDIESVKPGLMAAGGFSATRPDSNQKLKKEIDRMALDSSKYRYVFFASPGYSIGRHRELERPDTGVQVYATALM